MSHTFSVWSIVTYHAHVFIEDTWRFIIGFVPYFQCLIYGDLPCPCLYWGHMKVYYWLCPILSVYGLYWLTMPISLLRTHEGLLLAMSHSFSVWSVVTYHAHVFIEDTWRFIIGYVPYFQCVVYGDLPCPYLYWGHMKVYYWLCPLLSVCGLWWLTMPISLLGTHEGLSLTSDCGLWWLTMPVSLLWTHEGLLLTMSHTFSVWSLVTYHAHVFIMDTWRFIIGFVPYFQCVVCIDLPCPYL